MIIPEKISAYDLLNLPTAVTGAFVALCAIFALSPYAAGQDFGLFKIPNFGPGATRTFRYLGPVLVLLSVLGFAPVLEKSPKPEEVVEKTYRFAGPFKVARNDNTITFNLTEAVQDEMFSNRKVRIESVTVTGEVISESDEPFGFDQEVLVFSEPLSRWPRILGSTDYGKYGELRNGYSPPRRLLQLTSQTDDGRSVHSGSPINWTVTMSEASAPLGKLQIVKDTPITAGKEGIFVQLFLWTLWGGQHFVEFRNFEVKLKIRASSGAA